MRTRLFSSATIALLLLITAASCKKEQQQKEENAPITIQKKLGVMHLYRSNISQGSHKVIQNQAELNTLISGEDLDRYPDLKNIDFTRYTLLLGSDSYSNRVADIQYDLIKTTTVQYEFRVNFGGLATQPEGKFEYGALITKAPSSVNISFVATPL
ncbi:hypothetical protein [Niabella aurantiaca]|uniref:hypothetical protein n=1 Tax=Niabella aurantiaca TaxID=379900 RepID=UPI000363BD05|nr:hypothetical protein [Niabella aurantiaca]